MIAKHCERTRKHAIQHLHSSQQARVVRNPRLGSAWWYCDADSESLLQHKPRRKSPYDGRAAMIDNLKLSLRQFSRHLTSLEPAKRKLRPATQRLHYHFTRTTSAKHHQH